MNYELHPLCVFFPRMAGEEFRALCDDIRENGQSEPIVLHRGMILDGGNRYRACQEVGVQPIFTRYEGTNIVQFVLSANLHRRHLTEGQQAAIVASVTNWQNAAKHGGAREQGEPVPLGTRKQRAAVSGASEKTQGRADKVARADPALAAAVGRGEVSLPQAIRQITPAPEVEKIVRPTEVERLRARVAALEAEVEQLVAALAQAEDVAEQATDTAANLQATADGEGAKRLNLLTLKLRNAESQRNSLQNENADLKQQIKAMRRKMGGAG